VGFGSGVVVAGVSSTIFAPIQTWLVNPANVPPSPADGYFHDADLLAHVPGVFATLALVYLVMQCVGLVFICDPPQEVSSLL
jgi:hypothetical protein